jgi:hypothetical protein
MPYKRYLFQGFLQRRSRWTAVRQITPEGDMVDIMVMAIADAVAAVVNLPVAVTPKITMGADFAGAFIPLKKNWKN